MPLTPHDPTPPNTPLRNWLAHWIAANWNWHAKILSAPETSATQTHHPGPRVPRALVAPAFPSLADEAAATTVEFDIRIDSHGIREPHVRGIPHTGNGPFGPPHPELRITNLGTSSPLLDPENTGALTIFVFPPAPGPHSTTCRVWICRDQAETDIADDLIGPVEPGFPAPWGY